MVVPCRWAWFFLLSAMHVGLAVWTVVGPPIVGKWAAGAFTMIDQFKEGKGGMLSYSPCCCCMCCCCQLTFKRMHPHVYYIQHSIKLELHMHHMK